MARGDVQGWSSAHDEAGLGPSSSARAGVVRAAPSRCRGGERAAAVADVMGSFFDCGFSALHVLSPCSVVRGITTCRLSASHASTRARPAVLHRGETDRFEYGHPELTLATGCCARQSVYRAPLRLETIPNKVTGGRATSTGRRLADPSRRDSRLWSPRIATLFQPHNEHELLSRHL